MINLLELEPTKVSRDLRGKIILFYGEYKSGKTYNASKFPKALFLATEVGQNALDGAFVLPIQKWSDFKKAVKQLEDEGVREKFSTVIVDVVDIAYSLCEDFICAKAEVSEISEIPWGGGYSAVAKEFDSVLRRIVALGYGLVFISHSEDKVFTDETGKEYNKIVPTLPKRPRNIVLRMVDIIGYSKSVETPEGGVKQVLYMRGTPRFESGSRWKYVPNVIDFTYENLVKALNDAIDKQAQLDGATVTDDFINPYQERPVAYDYASAMAEVSELIKVLVTQNESNRVAIQEIVNNHFGVGKKLMDATPEQIDIVLLALEDLKDLLKKQ